MWQKRRKKASLAYEATTHIASPSFSGRFPKLSKFADKHGGVLILVCKVERFLGSAGLLGLSLCDLMNEGAFDGAGFLESRNFPQLGLVVTYVSLLLSVLGY